MISDKTIREVAEMEEADRRWEQQQEERKEAARHVLWHNGDHRGQQPGSFTEKILDAWARADMENAHRLAVAFPLLGEAVEISRTRGSDALAGWAGIA